MSIDLEKWQKAKKEKKLSYDKLAEITGYSRSTITAIFLGYVEYPRHETVEAIERALGIGDDPPQERETEQKEKAPSGGAGLYALTADEAILIDYYRRLVPANKITVFNLLKSVFETARDIPIETVREYIGVVN